MLGKRDIHSRNYEEIDIFNTFFPNYVMHIHKNAYARSIGENKTSLMCS